MRGPGRAWFRHFVDQLKPKRGADRGGKDLGNRTENGERRAREGLEEEEMGRSKDGKLIEIGSKGRKKIGRGNRQASSNEQKVREDVTVN